MSQFQIFQEPDAGERSWRWQFLDGNGEVVASCPGPLFKDEVRDAAKRVKDAARELAPKLSEAKSENSGSVEADTFKLEYDEAKDGKHAWRISIEGEVAAEGSIEASDHLNDALEGICKDMWLGKISYRNPKDDPAEEDKKTDSTVIVQYPGS